MIQKMFGKGVGLSLLKLQRINICSTRHLIAAFTKQQLKNICLRRCNGTQDKYTSALKLNWQTRTHLSTGSNEPANIAIANYEEVKDMINHPEKLLIDVRESDELKETGQIPTSIHIALGNVGQELDATVKAKDFNEKYGRDKPKENTEVIFYCKAGIRSLKAAHVATNLGYNNVKSYEGSWNEWAEREGLPK